jgi:archaellum component FlaC
MFGWLKKLFGGKTVKSVLDEVLGFFDKVEDVLGVFEELIHEGREMLEKIENEIREHERQIEELSRTKNEVAQKIERIKKVLGE